MGSDAKVPLGPASRAYKGIRLLLITLLVCIGLRFWAELAEGDDVLTVVWADIDAEPETGTAGASVLDRPLDPSQQQLQSLLQQTSAGFGGGGDVDPSSASYAAARMDAIVRSTFGPPAAGANDNPAAAAAPAEPEPAKTPADKEAELPWNLKARPLLSEFPPIAQRLEFIRHLEKSLAFTTAVEVGVGVGDGPGVFAKQSLDVWASCTEYKLVDLWADGNELGAAQWRLKDWPETAELLNMRASAAAEQLEDGHFDYVYLDGPHDYCAVAEEIGHYWPKLRPGGILGGHPYVDTRYAIDKLGAAENWGRCEDGSVRPEAAKGAVDDFRKERGNLEVYTSDERVPSWYVQKPY